MILSLQLLNALLNLCLWLVNGVFTVALERIYVHASRLEFRWTGKTFATDSGEVSFFVWFKKALSSCLPSNPGGSQRYVSSAWVVILILLSILFLPGEIYVETGIGELHNCKPVESQSIGVCSAPWAGHSAVGIASSSLLVQKFQWIDSDWDVVYEGSSVNFSATDVHKRAIGGSMFPNSKIVAEFCEVTTSHCSECGTLTVGKDGGAFETIITNASIAREPLVMANHIKNNSYRGDLTYDTATGLAFFFWSVKDGKRDGKRRIMTKGIETLLADEEIFKVLNSNQTVWEIFPQRHRTRLYEISCAASGLDWTDLTRAVSIYRTVQMEQPGMKRVGIHQNIDKLPALNESDVLKSIFALKAEDIGSNCPGIVPQYTECGSFDFRKALVILCVLVLVAVLYFVLVLIPSGEKVASIPNTIGSWRQYAIRNPEAHSGFYISIVSHRGQRKALAIDPSWLPSPK